MLQKTIPKFFAFVISVALVCLIFSGCSPVSSQSENTRNPKASSGSGYDQPKVIATIESPEITESSGLVASKCQADVFWTHNDSGDEAFIYAVNKKGEKLGTWKVTGAKAIDWEDIAQMKDARGECVLYIGDIGNNTRVLREEFTIYRVPEPRIAPVNKSSSKKKPLVTETAETIKFSYPDARRDAETLMVHPVSGDVYIVSKLLSGAAAVYRLKSGFDPSKTNKLEKITDFSVPAIPNGFLTGGDIAPDGARVIVCDYFGAYELILPDGAKSFDEIWKQTPVAVPLGAREQGESVTYATDGKAIYAGSENKKSPIIEVRRK